MIHTRNENRQSAKLEYHANVLWQAMRSAGIRGLMRSEIYRLFGNNKSRSQVDEMLRYLTRQGKVLGRIYKQRGRRAYENWRAVAIEQPQGDEE